MVYSSEGEAVSIHSPLIARYFSSYCDFIGYLEAINRNYSKLELLALLDSLYRGYGKLADD